MAHSTLIKSNCNEKNLSLQMSFKTNWKCQRFVIARTGYHKLLERRVAMTYLMNNVQITSPTITQPPKNSILKFKNLQQIKTTRARQIFKIRCRQPSRLSVVVHESRLKGERRAKRINYQKRRGNMLSIVISLRINN